MNAEPKLVLLGGPGSGKTTFVSFVALCMAGEFLGLPGPNLGTLAAPLPEDDLEDSTPQQWDHAALMPVHVVLHDLASQLPPSGTLANAETVWRYIGGCLQQAALEEFAPFLRGELLNRGGLILFDGLDEVPDALDRREQIKQAVQDFAATFSRCRFLVTSRTYAYQRQDWKLDGFAEVRLSLFTPSQIRAFVDAWYAHMVELFRLTEVDAKDRAGVLKRTVERNDRIRELAERPLLLTLIAQLQTDGGGEPPERREELYDKAVELLLNRWESMKVRVREDGTRDIEPSLTEWLNAGRDAIRRQLNRLAFEAHRDQPQLDGTADVRQGDLIAALLAASVNRADVKVVRLEQYLRDRAGILASHGVGMYQFPHRSFQEYLAACQLTDDDFPDQVAELARKDPNRWREVVLLAGAKSARGSSSNAWALAEALCLEPPTTDRIEVADQWGALLAGRVLVECADPSKVAPRNADKLARVRHWQVRILRRNTLPATERALAGRTLAELGDPRTEVTSLDGMQFCLVPPGPFVMGRRPDEPPAEAKPQHRVDLPYPFFMARFPVTVAQWRQYVQLSSAAVEDESSLHGRENDPVVRVSWHDARRFCTFLAQAWRAWLPEGFGVTLPSEAEWEKTARGGEHIPADYEWVTPPRLADTLKLAPSYAQMRNPFPTRAYPWGSSFAPDRANVEGTVGETSAVGCYPVGFSPYGCEEMAGNVWEWTRSEWSPHEEFEVDFAYADQSDEETGGELDAEGDALRVLRGGSWADHQHAALCAFRDSLGVTGRTSYLGFRVVARSIGVAQAGHRASAAVAPMTLETR